MTTENFTSAKTLQETIAKLTSATTKIATTGAKVKIEVTDSAGSGVLVSKDAIVAAIGQTAYNTLIAETLTTLNTAIASAETTATTAFAAL